MRLNQIKALKKKKNDGTIKFIPSQRFNPFHLVEVV